MKGIGGNVMAVIQKKVETVSDIGEGVLTWANVQTIKGWLDLAGGNAGYSTYYAKTEESTHVFVADYVQLQGSVTAENCRMVIGRKTFDITYIDNPMEMGSGSQFEFYLRHTGGI